MSESTVQDKQSSIWVKVAGVAALGTVGVAFANNLSGVTPFVREFGLASVWTLGGGSLLAVFLFWFMTTVTELGKEAIGSHKEFLTAQTENSKKQNEILAGITQTQAVHGEKLEHHGNILEELRRDRGRPCSSVAGSVSPNGN